MTSKRNLGSNKKAALPLAVRNKFDELQQKLATFLMTNLFYIMLLPIHHM